MRRQDSGYLTSLIAGHAITRRELLIGGSKLAASGALAAAFTNSVVSRAFAQSTPVAGMNYPELKVTITKDGFQASAKEIPAGYILLTVTNQMEDSDSAFLIGPGQGQTMDELMQAAAAAAATPEAFPAIAYTAAILGGPGDLAPGDTGQAIIQVPAGDWVIVDEGNLPGAPITATAGTPTSQTPPSADVTITEVDFAFGGFDATFPVGKQIWQVTNQGKQPHMLVLQKLKVEATVADILVAFSQPENATPTPGGFGPGDLEQVSPGGVVLQSSGTTVWPILDLEAGRYAAFCFVPDERNGQPHVMEGMIAVFEVGAAGGTPTP
ncbi:MAG TPA: hypothetical protein VFL82_02375 [Thermomicrobiales bacterium]|nr:hypothetical protein [Thermomicrobiales bacterium]